MSQKFLHTISGPQDLKGLDNNQLEELAQEIREKIIETTSLSGGHVASSLGAVDIIVAIHSLLDSPNDKLLFDVGHQSYAHKLITGRYKDFDTLRSYAGISGFTRPGESEHDFFSSGHASDSLSLALGLAKERDLSGGHEKIVTLIGDASISGGMAFEALNHIGQAQCPLLIILNDNEMSIDKNVGALRRHLCMLRATHGYGQARDTFQELMKGSNKLVRNVLQCGKNWKNSIKNIILPHAMIYEKLGIVCTTPIDGHNIPLMRNIFSVALQLEVPVLVHVITSKGKGFEPACSEPERFHGIGPYNINTGADMVPEKTVQPYSQVFSDALCKEASQNEKIVAITAAMASGTGLQAFSCAYPSRFIDTGIAEEHAVGMAAGISKGGGKPVVCIYSTFFQRAIDQVISDCAIDNLDVVFCLSRAGLVGADGPTHHGVFDLVYLRMIPNMHIYAPSNERDLVNCLHTALHKPGLFAIRYPKGDALGLTIPDEAQILPKDCACELRSGRDVSILAFGSMVSIALQAADLLEESGIQASVTNMLSVKPLDRGAIISAAKCGVVVTLEDGVIMGGAGSGVLEELSYLQLQPRTLQLGIPDNFVQQGTIKELQDEIGISPSKVAQRIRSFLKQS